MPTYEYESEEPRLRVICVRSVADRDKPILLTRVQIPTGISLANTDTGRSKAPSLEKDIMAGYAKLEQDRQVKKKEADEVTAEAKKLETKYKQLTETLKAKGKAYPGILP